MNNILKASNVCHVLGFLLFFSQKISILTRGKDKTKVVTFCENISQKTELIMFKQRRNFVFSIFLRT